MLNTIISFFILIVFIAEVIIAITIISKCLKYSKIIKEYTAFLKDANPKLEEILNLTNRLSEQSTEIVKLHIDKFKENADLIFLNQTSNILKAILLWYINKTITKKIKRKKLFKTLSRAFSMLQSMV